MKALILQKLVPLLTTFALFLNSLGGMLGIGVIIPYNPERIEVAVSGDVITQKYIDGNQYGNLFEC